MTQIKVALEVMALIIVVMLMASCMGTNKSPYTAGEMAQIILSSQPGDESMQLLELQDEQFIQYVFDFYSIYPETLLGGSILFADGMKAREIAVMIFSEESKAEQAVDTLENYIDTRQGDFVGYAPDQAELMDDARVVISGNTVALIICEDPQAAEDAFVACFSSSPPTLPDLGNRIVIPQQSREQRELNNALLRDPYDHELILEAWKSGDPSELTLKNRAIYDKAVQVIQEIISDDMSDYEKELAVYDWILEWTLYDEDYANQSPSATPDPDNHNPYGLLTHHTAICYGYTTTFQLFMDMLEIECISVNGTSHRGEQEHAWNLVKLDDDWYCVDLTWSDSAGDGEVSYMFFNLTSQEFEQQDHQWDKSAVPNATGIKYRDDSLR